MKLFRSAVNFLGRNWTKEPISFTHRFFSDGNGNTSNEVADRVGYSSNLESSFTNGISITSYNQDGFRLNQFVQVIGPTILFPRSVLSWNIKSVKHITYDSLMIFGLIQPRIETLIIGTGEKEVSADVSRNILEISRKHNINVEILSTELACTQFNFLNSEGRMIAAALIPPETMPLTDEDVLGTLAFDNKLFSLETMVTPGLQNSLKDTLLHKK